MKGVMTMNRTKAVSFCLAAMLCLSACAKTPDRPIVAQKNQERLMEQAQSGDENRQSLQKVQEEKPKDYSFQFRSNDGKVSISAEADVLLPETDRIPMYHVSASGFSQEQVTAVYDYLFAGEETWYAENDWYYTKAMADDDLAIAREELARLEADTQMDEEVRKGGIEFCKDIINDRETNYNSYPDSIVKIQADSTFRTKKMNSIRGDYDYEHLSIRSDSGKRLSCFNFPNNVFTGSALSFMSETGQRYSGNPTQADQNRSVPYGTNVPFSCAYSYEEAKALADKIFQVAGVNVRLVQTELLQGFYESPWILTKYSVEYDEEYCAYRFCYSRVIDGIPVAATTNTALYLEDTNPTWLYEKIYVTVDSGGISNLHWGYPVSCEDLVDEDVQILSFEEAARIFEEMAPLIYQGKNAALEEESKASRTITISVDTVELNLMRIRDGGNVTGLYVPAWVFYGSEELAANGSPNPAVSMSPWIILAVNAVDGSIIDVKAGY